MTIEELKALEREATEGPWEVMPGAYAVHQPKFQCWIPQDINDARLNAALRNLAPEILALAEAASDPYFCQWQGQQQFKTLFSALDAFNAKLEAL